MERYCINNISQVDENKLTFADLMVHFGTGQVITISGSGRDRKTAYRSGMQTAIGDIEISVWKILMQNLIAKNEEKELFNNLYEWERTHNYCNRDKDDLYLNTLSIFAARLFDCEEWVDYQAFNACYRPDVLQK